MRAASYRVFVCLLVLLSLPQLAFAESYSCDGQVTSIGLNDNAGRVWVAYGAIGIQAICEVDATYNGVLANTCKAWLALLMAAQAQQRTIRLYYYSTTAGNPASCAGFQAWGAYSPYFIQTID